MWHKKKKDKEQNNPTQGNPEEISSDIYAAGGIFRCDNGHWYDGEEYKQCPHCGSQRVIEIKPKNPPKDDYEYSSELHSETLDEPHSQQSTLKPSGGTIPIFGDIFNKIEEAHNAQNEEKETDKPQPPQENSGENKEIINEHQSAEEIKKSLKEAIKGASASSGQVTTSYFKRISNERSAPEKAETTNITAVAEKQEQKFSGEPVVGWLVCIKGSRFGESFGIYSGNNSIGRNEENRIVISNDNDISRLKHAIIVYEPKKRNFYLLPGDSSGLTYLNDDYVSESKMIKAYDVIGLGESKFTFVPLCGEAFTWEDFYKGE